MTRKTTSHLLIRSVRCFSTLLENSIESDDVWKKLSNAISRHGLLSFTVANQKAERVPAIDTEQLGNDRKYRAQIARQLSKPLAPDYRTVVIPLDRSRLVEPEYRHKMAGILGYRWVEKLGAEQAEPATKLTILQSTPELLLECLDRLQRHQSHAEGVMQKILWRFAEEEMDRDPNIVKVFDKLNKSFDEIERRYHEQVNSRLEAIQADTKRKLDEIVERIWARSVG